jgi:hypothetical protein
VRRNLARPALALLALLTACSFFTSLDDFSDGTPSATEADGGPAPDTVRGDASEAADTSETPLDAGDPRSAAYAAAVLLDHPISYFRFEETSGTTAKDEIGAHEGLYVFSALLTEPGVANSHATRFPSSTNAHVEVPSTSFRFPGSAPFSLELWVKPAAFTSYQWLMSTEKGQNPRRGWSVFANGDGELRYEAWGPAVTDAAIESLVRWGSFGAPLTLERFHHLVITFDGSLLLGFLDGVQEMSRAAGGLVPDAGSLVVGCRAFIPGADFVSCLANWTVDEVALYAYPLTWARVSAHYERGR